MKRLFLTFLAVIFSCGQLSAGENNTVVLGANHVPPFKIIEGETLSGINGDILKEIFRDTGLKMKIKKCPWKRCLTELEEGRIDVFLGLFKSPEREKLFRFCDPPYSNRSDKAFYLRRGEGHRVNKYDDLYKLRIGVTRGYKNFERFDSDEKLNKEFVAEHILNIKKLVAGRLDVFIQTELAADYLIKTKGYAEKIEKAPYKYGEIHPSYFVISRKSPYMKHVEHFEKNLRLFVEEKKYSEIIKKWTQEISERAKGENLLTGH